MRNTGKLREPQPVLADLWLGPAREASTNATVAGRRGLGWGSIDWRRVVDGAFPHIVEVPRGGREVVVVVEHDQVMLGCRGADQEVHGRQYAVGSVAQQAILRGLYPPPCTLG